MDLELPSCSLDTLLEDSIAALFVSLDLCGRRRHSDRHVIDHTGEFIVAFFVVFAHRRAELVADVFGFVRRVLGCRRNDLDIAGPRASGSP